MWSRVIVSSLILLAAHSSALVLRSRDQYNVSSSHTLPNTTASGDFHGYSVTFPARTEGNGSMKATAPISCYALEISAPFAPDISDEYVFSGTCDTSMDLRALNAKFEDFCDPVEDFAISHHHPDDLVIPGIQSAHYVGTNAAVRLRISYPMVGGSMTWHQFDESFSGFCGQLENDSDWAKYYATSYEVEYLGGLKYSWKVDIDEGYPIDIGLRNGLRFEGYTYPSRPIPEAELVEIFAKMALVATQHPAHEWVSVDTYFAQETANLDTIFVLNGQPGMHSQGVTYEDLYRFLVTFPAEIEPQHMNKALFGSLYLGNTWVGRLEIKPTTGNPEIAPLESCGRTTSSHDLNDNITSKDVGGQGGSQAFNNITAVDARARGGMSRVTAS